MTNRGNTPAAGTRPRMPGDAAPIASRSPNENATRETAGQSDRRRRRSVSWYASALIVMTLLLAAGWELLRWIVLIVTFD